MHRIKSFILVKKFLFCDNSTLSLVLSQAVGTGPPHKLYTYRHICIVKYFGRLQINKVAKCYILLFLKLNQQTAIYLDIIHSKVKTIFILWQQHFKFGVVAGCWRWATTPPSCTLGWRTTIATHITRVRQTEINTAGNQRKCRPFTLQRIS